VCELGFGALALRLDPERFRSTPRTRSDLGARSRRGKLAQRVPEGAHGPDDKARIYSSSAGGVPGPYGVSVHAPANMERKVRIDPAGIGTVEESWEFKSQDGDSIQLQIQYARGASTPDKAETKFYSAAKPEFYRIYRSEQSTDVVRSPAADRVQKVLFKASGPTLWPLFDGSEQLIGVTSDPWYTRQTFLPAS
jgi:hypothetical protein